MNPAYLFTIVVCAIIESGATIANAGAFSFPSRQHSFACDETFDFLSIEGISDPSAKKNKNRILDTDSFVVWKGKSKIIEAFAPGFQIDTPHRMWSASKLIANLVVARAVGESKIKLDQRLDEFFPGKIYQKNAKSLAAYKKITVRDLLMMRSGFQWHELETIDLMKLNVVHMVYGKPSQNTVDYILRQPVLPDAAGKVFNYSTADYVILSGILRKVYGAEYENLPWKLLFNPLSMDNVVVERDRAGTYLLGSHVYMSARNFGKIGALLMNDGKWGNQRFLPVGWVEFMRKPNPGQLVPEFSLDRLKKVGALGSPFYLNEEIRGVPRVWPSFPPDTFMSFGFMGQNLAVIPSRNLMIVRFGQDIRYGKKLNALGEKLFPCIESIEEGDRK